VLLKAGTAKNGPTLGGLEWHRRFFAALRTVGSRFRAHAGAASDALGLALLAMLGVVFELFIVEE